MTESIFPFINPEEVESTSEDLPIAQEWAWDFERLEFKTKNGKMYLVQEDEAIKIWLWKLFHTSRFRSLIYDWDYGHELEELIGQGFTEGLVESEAERYVREAVEYNLPDYVTELENVEVDFKGEQLTIVFRAITPYGEVDMIV